MIISMIGKKDHEINELRAKNRDLLDQYEALKQTYDAYKSASGVKRVMEERDRYLEELKAMSGGANPKLMKFGSDEEKYLKAKNFHYESLVERLERERAEL